MNGLIRLPVGLASLLLPPLLTLAAPPWLSIVGVGPSWGVLWLLPWALVDGPLSGALGGLALGLLLDGLHPGAVSEWPVLVLLGWWWGQLGRRFPQFGRSFSLGLLAMLGALLLGLSLLLQFAFAHAAGFDPGLSITAGGITPRGWSPSVIALAGLQTLAAQSLITGLLAPVLCSLQLLFWRRQRARQR